jgi:nucleosome assembly protein 1-like 1
MKNSGRVRELITERDEPALHHLVDVIATTLPEIPPPETTHTALGDGDSKAGSGTWAFQLEFVFRPNEFFTNTRLVKTYWLADTPEVEVVRSEGCAIEWREGKCLTMRTVRKKRRNRAGRGMRTVLRTERCDSFFHFFAPPQPPQPEEGADGEVDMVERERYEEGLEDDGEVQPASAPADRCCRVLCVLLSLERQAWWTRAMPRISCAALAHRHGLRRREAPPSHSPSLTRPGERAHGLANA